MRQEEVPSAAHTANKHAAALTHERLVMEGGGLKPRPTEAHSFPLVTCAQHRDRVQRRGFWVLWVLGSGSGLNGWVEGAGWPAAWGGERARLAPRCDWQRAACGM